MIAVRGVLGLVLLLLGCADGAPHRVEPCADCSLVLVSLDTLRADRLGSYGYARDTSPELDAFAADAVRFSDAYSASRKTAPAHASLFTGLYPSVHGVFMNDAGRGQGRAHYRLDARVPTLPELLARAGFATAAWHGGGNVAPGYGFARGFAQYTSFASYRGAGDRGPAGFRRSEWRPAFRWLAENSGRRFFVFLHTYAIHDPYQPPEPYYSMFTGEYAGRIRPVPNDRHRARRFWAAVDEDDPRDIQHLKDLYDGGIRYADAHLVAPLLRTLESNGLLDDTIVVFVSDHGEEFKEHGQTLHEQLYEEIVRVPLLVRLPQRMTGGEPLRGVRATRVSLVDLAPTLLELLAVDYDPAAFQGRSLVPVLRGTGVDPRGIYAEGLMAKWDGPSRAGNERLQRVLREGDHKLYARELEANDVYQVFDLAQDPGEAHNLSLERPELLDELRSRLVSRKQANQRFRVERGYEVEAGEYDDALLDELRALGYVE